ncbi:MAG: hypothetical protein WBW35_14490 [Xanthobacteraceae bacterium]
MFDLLAAAERCRSKAHRCELLATDTTSAPFAKCYRQLADLLVSTADLEEDFVRRDLERQRGLLQIVARLDGELGHQLADHRDVERTSRQHDRTRRRA